MVYRLFKAVLESPALVSRMQKSLAQPESQKAQNQKAQNQKTQNQKTQKQKTQNRKTQNRKTQNRKTQTQHKKSLATSFGQTLSLHGPTPRMASRMASHNQPSPDLTEPLSGISQACRGDLPAMPHPPNEVGVGPHVPLIESHLLTPPPQDLFLVTRGDEPVSANLMSSFQPGDLFREDLGLYERLYEQQQGIADAPNVSNVPGTSDGTVQNLAHLDQLSPPHSAVLSQGSSHSPSFSPDSTSSNSPPSTFNIDDWYTYFGIDKDPMVAGPDCVPSV
jgi:hypothetical protein